MDEISRDQHPDATIPRAAKERTKGPEELLLQDRGIVAAEPVMTDPRENRLSSESALPPMADRLVSRVEEVAAEVPAEAIAEVEDVAEVEAPVDVVAETIAVPTETLDAPVTDANDLVDASAAAAAVAAGEEVAMVEEEVETVEDQEGLPPVPELADPAAIARMVFVLVLTQREGLTLFRLAQACNTTQKLVEQALELVRADLAQLNYPLELSRTGDSLKLMSAPETFPYLQRLKGVKKLEKLSAAALETLAVIAYRQPVMRSEIEGIRGVKAGPMLRTLLQHKLVKVTGRADVPGRPLQDGTTPHFLERFGLESLQALPSVKEWKQL